MLRPWLPILLGVILMLGGFAWDVAFAGIPYPDPTPELQARYDWHAHLASATRWLGLCLAAIGLAWTGLNRLRQE